MATSKHLRLSHPMAPPFGFERRSTPAKLPALATSESAPELVQSTIKPADSIFRRTSGKYGEFWLTKEGPHNYGDRRINASQDFTRHLTATGTSDGQTRTRSLNTLVPLHRHRIYGNDNGGHRTTDYCLKFG
mmetsp:Transcript_36136/g.57805  ORF Transcript_36136/g.57805 Transcript_36136/m.57805 type:complete len:132 (-) Transcript_36136:140-535(-)